MFFCLFLFFGDVWKVLSLFFFEMFVGLLGFLRCFQVLKHLKGFFSFRVLGEVSWVF